MTKSSTEAELVALSDSTNVALHTLWFLRSQGYTIPHAILYQDNKSCMALIDKGRSTSDLTKHIQIRYFWVTQTVREGAAVIEYCPTEEMFSNLLTKPLQGKQFYGERLAMTGWVS